MDKVNEVVEACEQETPFHLLSQEEQQRILDANQKKGREAKTLHEWSIRVKTPYAWLIMSIPLGTLILIGVWLVSGDNMISLGWGLIVMGGGLSLYFRYLVMADKDYHYRLTTEGVIVTYQDSIPEIAYTIVRGLAWFGVVICVMAVAVLGPLALVGAGGMALLAVFFTEFKKEVTTQYIQFDKNCIYVFKVVKRKFLIRFETVPFGDGAFSDLYCDEIDFNFILKALMSELSCTEYREFNNEYSLRRSPLGVIDVGVSRKYDGL